MQPINDFSDKYMIPIDSESFKTPSLTTYTLPNSKLNLFFSKSLRYQNFEHLLKDKKQELNFDFLINLSKLLYKLTSHEIVC